MAVPIVPPAPPRFSMTIGCPSWLANGSSTMRPTMSRLEPAENGTMARIGRAGQTCARATCGNAGAARVAPASCRNRRRVVARHVMAPSPPSLPISLSRRTCDNSPREGGKPEALEHWFVGQREQAPRGRDGACRAVQRDVFALERGRQSGIAQPYIGEGHEIGGYDGVVIAARSLVAHLDLSRTEY